VVWIPASCPGWTSAHSRNSEPEHRLSIHGLARLDEFEAGFGSVAYPPVGLDPGHDEDRAAGLEGLR
jgi:hypothetical protein